MEGSSAGTITPTIKSSAKNRRMSTEVSRRVDLKEILLMNYQVHRVSREACKRPWELDMHMLWVSLLCWTELPYSICGCGPGSERDPSRLPELTAVYYIEPDYKA